MFHSAALPRKESRNTFGQGLDKDGLKFENEISGWGPKI